MSVALNIHSQEIGTQGWRGSVSTRVSEALDWGISEGVVTGGVVLAAQYGRFTVQICKGNKAPPSASPEPCPLQFSTVFDLGTLTEAVCTASLMMRLISAGKVSLLDRASRFVPALAIGERSRITLAHLLAHVAGYAPSITVADDIMRAHEGARPGLLASSGARHYSYKVLHKLPQRHAVGSRQLRSDADYILLGEICEAIVGMPLEKAFSRLIAAPLGLRSLNFIDLSTVRSKGIQPMTEVFATSGACPRRGRLICGEVLDEHTWAMGGVSGHNGLFGTADDLLVWGAEILAALKGRSDILSQDVARSFLTPELPGFDSDWRLGFEGLSSRDGTVAAGVAAEAVTVSSGTGCSLVIEPKRDLVAVVLTSGGALKTPSKRLASLRADIHTALLETE
jgi:CubicO group peptidase (beta-lactamase class C family)